MSDPSTNAVLEQIAANFGGGVVKGQDVKRPQIVILEDIAKNTAGGGGGGPGYDDTALKARVKATEDKNTEQDSTLALLTAEDGDLNTALSALAQGVQTANQKNDSQDLIITSLNKSVSDLTIFNSSLIVPWGDSRCAQNWNTSVPNVPLARSPLWWMEMLSQRVRMDVTYMQGVSGDDISQLLARMTNDTPGQFGTKKPSEVPPCIAWLQIGTNEVNKGTPLATMLDKLNQCIDWLIAHGHKVLLLAEWPRGAVGATDSQLSADNQKLLTAYHNSILKIRRKDVFIVDVWPRAVDPASAIGYPLPNMLNPDTLHNSPGIAMVTGQEAVRVMIEEMKLPRHKITASASNDLYDAVLEPQGCINTNPMLSTTGGTVTGPAATGAAPLGYTLSTSNAGLTAVGSFVDITTPDGAKRKAFRIVVSGTPTATNQYVSLRQSGLLARTAINDILETNYEVVVADGHVNFAAPGILMDTGVAATRAHGGLSITGDNIAPSQAVRGFYGVPRCSDLSIGPTLPASVSFDMRMYFTAANVASSLTIDILSSSVRKKKQ